MPVTQHHAQSRAGATNTLWIFFLGYFLLEIPGALIVEQWSALSAGNGGAFSLGVIVYMTHWFPPRDRDRAMSRLILAVPLSFLLGAPLSAACLSLHAFGMSGWRWIFILQGLPAVVFGLITPFYLTDHPHQAAWLEPEERDWIVGELDSERQSKRKTGHLSILRALVDRNVLTLGDNFGLVHGKIVGPARREEIPHCDSADSGGCLFRSHNRSRPVVPVDDDMALSDGARAVGVGAVVLGAADSHAGRVGCGGFDRTH